MLAIRDKEKELDELLRYEEIWWSQRSRALWLKHGDKNTSYFHQKANQRRRRNSINQICDSQGTTHYEPVNIEATLIKHFQNIFKSQETTHMDRTTEVVKNIITNDMFQQLEAEFTKDEVVEAINSMKGLAAPGPNGLPAIFYHTYWEIINKEVINSVLHVLNNKVPLSTTLIFASFLRKRTLLTLVTIDLSPYAMCFLKSSLKQLPTESS
jgi:hypothetical protein